MSFFSVIILTSALPAFAAPIGAAEPIQKIASGSVVQLKREFFENTPVQQPAAPIAPKLVITDEPTWVQDDKGYDANRDLFNNEGPIHVKTARKTYSSYGEAQEGAQRALRDIYGRCLNGVFGGDRKDFGYADADIQKFEAYANEFGSRAVRPQLLHRCQARRDLAKSAVTHQRTCRIEFPKGSVDPTTENRMGFGDGTTMSEVTVRAVGYDPKQQIATLTLNPSSAKVESITCWNVRTAGELSELFQSDLAKLQKKDVHYIGTAPAKPTNYIGGNGGAAAPAGVSDQVGAKPAEAPFINGAGYANPAALPGQSGKIK